jgi:hypothetical protein
VRCRAFEKGGGGRGIMGEGGGANKWPGISGGRRDYLTN